MALNWEWSDKMGECIYDSGAKANIYKGNAYMITVFEDEENNTYSMSWFASDRNHFKNLLGLGEYRENAFADWDIVKIRLDSQYKHVPDIVQLIAKSKTKIDIELY